jgi:A/G-specific adenine glycosylase
LAVRPGPGPHPAPAHRAGRPALPVDPQAPEAAALVAPLLDWMAGARRDLPWRTDRDPYTVWISEIMLQQTQAATVVPYFERWFSRFPNVAALAAASLDDVLKVWSGLGYYARARNLHAAARAIMSHHGGQIPADRTELLQLPGIGRYTAGAILSLAFGQAEPVLDGNVRRVLCRVYDVEQDSRAPAAERLLWTLAEALVEAAPQGRAGDLNESLMELGALVCVPGTPLCPECPLAAACLAHARGVASDRPRVTPAPRTPHYAAAAAVIVDDAGRYLIAQRPPEGLLGGLWEFPGIRAGLLSGSRQHAPDALALALATAVREKLGIEILPGASFLQVRHAYTHFRITLQVFRATLVSGEPRPLGYAAVGRATLDELQALAFPVTDQKIIAALPLPS